MRASRILATAALLLIGSGTMATPAHAQDGCIDGTDGKPICTAHVGPPPPPDWMRPAPLPAPGFDNSTPINTTLPPAAPAPPSVAPAPAPIYQAPPAPQPVHRASAVPVPVYSAPVPVQGQAPVQVNGIDVVPVPALADAAVAPEGVQGEPEATAAPMATTEPSASPVAAAISEPLVGQGDPAPIEAAPASSASDSTPVIIGVASLIVIGGVLWMVLHAGPGVAGIRGLARGLLRR